MTAVNPIRVLVVDDSALVRDILSVGLSRDPGIVVVGTAADPFEAGEKIPILKPDVMTLDVEMPRMNGLEFLRRLMPQYPLPVIMVSALTERGKQLTLDALSFGAVDFVTKPKSDLTRGMEVLLTDLTAKIKVAAKAKLLRFHSATDTINRQQQQQQMPTSQSAAFDSKSTDFRPSAEASSKVIVIGASTGGTDAVREVVRQLPSRTPGIVVIQHMPAGFTRLFANRLAADSTMSAKEAEDGQRILTGQILVAPGGKQVRIRRNPAGGYLTSVTDDGPVNNHAPSVDVTFYSTAEAVGRDAVGIVLTGMGADGAEGLKAMRLAGARCLAQDEATSVIFGMPAEAFKRGGAERLVPLGEMAGAILDCIK